MTEAARKLEEQAENATVSETVEEKTPFEKAAEQSPEAVRELVKRLEEQAEGEVDTSTKSVEEYAKEEPEIVEGIKISEAEAKAKLKQAAKNAETKAGVAEPAAEEEVMDVTEDKDVEFIETPKEEAARIVFDKKRFEDAEADLKRLDAVPEAEMTEKDAAMKDARTNELIALKLDDEINGSNGLLHRARVTIPKLIEMNRKKLDALLAAERATSVEDLSDEEQKRAKTFQNAIQRDEAFIAGLEAKAAEMGERKKTAESAYQEAMAKIRGESPEPEEEAPEITGVELEDVSELDEQMKGLETTIEGLEAKPKRTPLEDARLEAAKIELDMAVKQLDLKEHEQQLQSIDGKLEKLGKEYETLLDRAPANDIDKLSDVDRARVDAIQAEMNRLEDVKVGGKKEVIAALGSIAAMDRLLSKAKANVRSLETAQPKKAEAAKSIESSGKEEPHAAKRIAKTVGIAGALGASVGLLSISKVFDWIDRGLKRLQYSKGWKDMLHTLFVKPTKWLLTRPEAALDKINERLTGKKPKEEKERHE